MDYETWLAKESGQQDVTQGTVAAGTAEDGTSMRAAVLVCERGGLGDADPRAAGGAEMERKDCDYEPESMRDAMLFTGSGWSEKGIQ